MHTCEHTPTPRHTHAQNSQDHTFFFFSMGALRSLTPADVHANITVRARDCICHSLVLRLQMEQLPYCFTKQDEAFCQQHGPPRLSQWQKVLSSKSTSACCVSMTCFYCACVTSYTTHKSQTLLMKLIISLHEQYTLSRPRLHKSSTFHYDTLSEIICGPIHKWVICDDVTL